jgi:hypothetical protein
MEEKNVSQQINIELKEEIGQGNYANLVVITHSSSEFVMDFVRIMPGLPKAQVVSRIIMNPENAKRFHKALGENILRFEDANGKINTNNSPIIPPINFGGGTAQA